MDKYIETFTTWNDMALLYQDKFMNIDLYNESYDFICRYINKNNAKLLEIACGPGNITKYLLSKRPDFDIMGIDIAPNMIELAKKNNPTAYFTVMDCRQIHLLHKKFDGIIAGFYIPYLSKDECDHFLTNTYNLLEDNGILYFSFVEGYPKDSEFKNGPAGRVFFNYHLLDHLISKLNFLSFSDIKILKVPYKVSDIASDIHTIVTASKINNQHII